MAAKLAAASYIYLVLVLLSTINHTRFKLNSVSQNDVSIVIKNLCNDKANLHGDIPAQVLKLSLDSYIPELTKIINNCFQNGSFLNELKHWLKSYQYLKKVTPY